MSTTFRTVALALWSLGCTTGAAPLFEGDAGLEREWPAACALRCGADCCDAGQECLEDTCVAACEGTPCGESLDACCDPGRLCVNHSCVLPGVPSRWRGRRPHPASPQVPKLYPGG